MPFLNVSYTNFRNLNDATIDLLSKEVYFVGENGQGKSNILESLYLISYGNSFRTNNDKDMIKDGNKEFSVRAEFIQENELKIKINVLYSESHKKITKNDKNVSDRKELIYSIPTVLFCHEDLDFVSGIPERKRWFLDQTLSMYKKSYLDDLRIYKKILKTRNNVLKESQYLNEDLLNTLDIQLVNSGIQLIKAREICINAFNEFFGVLYENISGISDVEIKYTPSWKNIDLESVLETMKNNREVEKTLKTTISGPHRDRIGFTREKKLFIPSASTGQRRILSLLLRVAQAKHINNETEIRPILLMDDVLLELDIEKREKFINLLPEYDQLFCTFLPQEPYQKYMSNDTKIYKISEGKWNNA